MVLTIKVGAATLTITRTTDRTGPFPWLLNVGTARIAANSSADASLGVDESPSLSVTLANYGGQAARVLRRPFRAEVHVLNDDGSEFFSGFVSGIELGREILLQIEP